MEKSVSTAKTESYGYEDFPVRVALTVLSHWDGHLRKSVALAVPSDMIVGNDIWIVSASARGDGVYVYHKVNEVLKRNVGVMKQNAEIKAAAAEKNLVVLRKAREDAEAALLRENEAGRDDSYAKDRLDKADADVKAQKEVVIEATGELKAVYAEVDKIITIPYFVPFALLAKKYGGDTMRLPVEKTEEL